MKEGEVSYRQDHWFSLEARPSDFVKAPDKCIIMPAILIYLPISRFFSYFCVFAYFKPRLESWIVSFWWRRYEVEEQRFKTSTKDYCHERKKLAIQRRSPEFNMKGQKKIAQAA